MQMLAKKLFSSLGYADQPPPVASTIASSLRLSAEEMDRVAGSAWGQFLSFNQANGCGTGCTRFDQSYGGACENNPRLCREQ